VAWQGGEPTIMGVDFFRRAIALQEKYKKPGMTFENTMQTNGTLLTDEWCEFYKENDFLIGLSIDGRASFTTPIASTRAARERSTGDARLALLQKHGVEFNILTTVNRINGDRPLEVYRFLRDEVKTTWMQFIPSSSGSTTTAGRSTRRATRYRAVGQAGTVRGVLECDLRRWVHHDVGNIFVQTFEAAAAVGSGCRLECASSNRPAGPASRSSITATYTRAITSSSRLPVRQRSKRTNDRHARFGLPGEVRRDKLDTLPKYCLECDVRFACNGECPKNRFIETPEGSLAQLPLRGLQGVLPPYRRAYADDRRPHQTQRTGRERGADARQNGSAMGVHGRKKRSVPMRQRREVQEMATALRAEAQHGRKALRKRRDHRALVVNPRREKMSCLSFAV